LAGWSRRAWTAALALGAVVAWAGYCWYLQLRYGLGVTGLDRPVFWGMYIVDFDFFLGIAYGLVLLSAVLRLAGADWRRAGQRLAAVGAVFAMIVGPVNILLDLGRLDHLHKVYAWGRMQSPLLWDVASIMTFLITCVVYLFLPLIPDFGLLRERVGGWRKPIYEVLSFGWTGSDAQVAALDRAHRVLAVLVVFIAVIVRSVVAWITSLTLQPLWHTALSGPVYVVSALFTSAAVLTLLMASMRRAFGLEDVIKAVHFEKLGVVLLVCAAISGYLLVSELLTVSYGNEPDEMAIIATKVSGRFAPLFWLSVAGTLVLPAALLARKSWRTVSRTVAASVSICIGAWAQLYTELVPVLEHPRMPLPGSGHYRPSMVEISLFAGCLAGFVLLTMIFTRLVPVVAVFYERRGRDTAAAEAAERAREYYAEVAS
ncbi:MAG TPA: NrfD/PsrC family molybdoenzyme membrane anchor subunit, partial [Myxococcales bacterium]|nr:NrfD/PsrC family molybdoenzyme membrane anchor subunit [Myxococcales bacterium]